MIQITENAAQAVGRMKQELSLPETTVLRLGVVGGGCSGFSYDVKFGEPKEKDKIFDANGVTVAVDPKSLLYLAGITVDYEDTVMHKGFVFNNPNATKSCGCGTSFSV